VHIGVSYEFSNDMCVDFGTDGLQNCYPVLEYC